MSNTTNINFPSKWNIDKLGAKDFYEQCLPYIKETDDFYEIADVSIYYTVFAILAMVYMLIINIWLFVYHKSYIFKRQCVSYYVFLLIGSLVITFDNILVEVNFH